MIIPLLQEIFMQFYLQVAERNNNNFEWSEKQFSAVFISKSGFEK